MFCCSLFLFVYYSEHMNPREKDIFDAIVIGGGPSGMMAAGRAGERGARILLIEKNRHLGRKLLLTGGGRCNITNALFDTHEFLKHFPQTKQYLYSPFSKFSVKDTFSFFEALGLPLVIEARNRAFPKTQDAHDVVRVLKEYMSTHGVKVRTGLSVTFVKKRGDLWEVGTSNEEIFHARSIVVATGGFAYPETGSTGDGFEWLRKMGHRIVDPSPNLVPLTTDESWVHALSGITLSFMRLRFLQGDKTVVKDVGKLLFTHFGISGPLVLNNSYEVIQMLKKGEVIASIDMFPDTDLGELDKRVIALFERTKNKLAVNAFSELVQEGVAEQIVTVLISSLTGKQVHSVTKDERKQLVRLLKDMRFSISGTLGFDKAIIADGGIDCDEVDMRTMRSKKDESVYILGDSLHINRPSGGFSLQLCWTTGSVAGEAIGEASEKA